jgi:hypothetical protein
VTTAALNDQTAAIRASDADRAKALSLLRDHWLAGRLTLEEYEERCDEAGGGRFLDDLRRALRELPYPLPEHPPVATAEHAHAQPPSAPQSGAVLALVLGATSLLGIVMSFGLLFLLTLPASTWAWLLGRRIRRAERAAVRGDVRVLAAVGEGLGIVATLLGCLALMACAVVVRAL